MPYPQPLFALPQFKTGPTGGWWRKEWQFLRLSYPTCHNLSDVSVVRAWLLLSAPGRGCKAVPWPWSSCSRRAGSPQTCVHLSPCQAGGCGQPQPAYYCSIQLNIDGSVWRSAQASQQTPEKTKIHLALTMSSLTDIFFPDPLLGKGGGGAEALWRG